MKCANFAAQVDELIEKYGVYAYLPAGFLYPTAYELAQGDDKGARLYRQLWVRHEMSEQQKAEYDSQNMKCFFNGLVNEPYDGCGEYLDLDNPTVAKHKDEIMSMISEYTRITQQRDKEIAAVESDRDANKTEIEQNRDNAKQNIKKEKEAGYKLNKNKKSAEAGTIDYAQWLRDHPQDR